MRYEDEIDRSRRRQSRGREIVKRSGQQKPGAEPAEGADADHGFL